MDSPMTTPTSTSPNSKLTELRKEHDELKSQFDMLVKQVEAMNLQPSRVDVVIDKPNTDEPKAPKADKAPKKPKSSKKENTPSFPLPWTGTPITGCCQGIRSNYDTYTQCHQPCIKDNIYCKTCAKNCGSDGIPKDGNVDTRNNITKKIKPYIHFMNAKQLSKQDVLNEAAKFNITLSDEIFEKPPTAAKGRPKKITSATEDSDDEQQSTQNPSIQILALLETEPQSPKSP